LGCTRGYPHGKQVDPDAPTQCLVRVGAVELRFIHGLLQTVRSVAAR
jgi:hypothetical protein